jgi:PIN domain nuclease of toxin-antitoxin system
MSKLIQLGRIELELDDRDLMRAVGGLTIWPITLDVCRATLSLYFSSDPADEIIAAASLVHRTPLVTRDRKIQKSKLVPLAVR